MKQLNDVAVAAGDCDRATLARRVESLLVQINPNVMRERRREDRFAVPALFRLTPLDSDREPIEFAAAIVVGKNISRRGMSFFHEQPLTHRRALIELAQPGLGDFAAEIDVSWCRFARPGWYESGGRLVRAVAPRGEDAALLVPQVGFSRMVSHLVAVDRAASGRPSHLVGP